MNKFFISDVISLPILNTYYHIISTYLNITLYINLLLDGLLYSRILKSIKLLFFRQKFVFTLFSFYSIPFLLYFVEFSFKKFVYVKLFGNSFKLSNSKYTSFKLVYISPSESSLHKSVLLVQVKLPPAF